MRHSVFILRCSLLLIAYVVICCRPAPADMPENNDHLSWSKTVEYRHENVDIRYSVSLSVIEAKRIRCELVFENTSSQPVFFLEREAADPTREGKALRISIGNPHLYYESGVPRLALVKAGTTLSVTYDVGCEGGCSSLNYAYVTFFFRVHNGNDFWRVFSQLEGDEYKWFVRSDVLWEQYYQYLETETLLFSLVPLTE